MKIWKIAVLYTAVFVSACGDVETVPTKAPVTVTPRSVAPSDGPQGYVSIGSQTAPAEAPAEFAQETALSLEVDVGFAAFGAYGQGILRYQGTNASVDVDLVVRNAQGSNVGSNKGSEQDSHTFPWNRTLTASTTVAVTQNCGLIAQATAIATVWQQFIIPTGSMMSWGQKRGSGTRSASQNACPPLPPPPPPPASPPLGGGDTSAPPSSGSPAPVPPSYFPPYYEPRPRDWICIVYSENLDYERRECWWSEQNDAKLDGDSPLAAFRGSTGVSSTSNPTKLPSVFVIVSDAVPAGSVAVLERRKQGPFKNVLLVPSANLRPAELVHAMKYLYATYAAEGDSPKKEFTARLKGTVADSRVSAAERDYAASFTALLAKAKAGDAGKHGRRPILEIIFRETRSK